MSKRRLCIAAIFGCALLGWILSPRGDARFIGKWGMLGPGETAPGCFWVFRRGGLLEVDVFGVEIDIAKDGSQVPVQVKYGTGFMPWSIDGDRLLTGEGKQPSKCWSTAASVLGHVGIQLLEGAGNEFTIVSTSPDEIVLRGAGGRELRMVRQN